MRTGFAATAATVLLALPATAQALNRYGRADTGVVTVSSEPNTSQGEEPLSVNPLNPNQLTTVANVFEPDVPSSQNPFLGGGGIDDTRIYSSQDGGRHWLTQKLDQGGLGKLTLPLPAGTAPRGSDAFETPRFVDTPPQVYVKHSDDHGATWSHTMRVDDGTYQTQWNPRNRPAVGADGSLYVVYDRAPVTATPFAAYEGPITLVLA